MNARVVRALCCLAAWSLIAPASAADVDGTAVVVVVRSGADAVLGARIERDLRNMYDSAARAGKKVFPVRAIEPRFDVGRLSKADLETSRRHFNDAQRALE